MQLKQQLFKEEISTLDAFMKNLLQVLDERMKSHEAIIHVGESYDYREYSNRYKTLKRKISIIQAKLTNR